MKRGILITSFGTSHKDTREKNIEVIENLVKEKYGEDVVERAFTSNIVRKVILENEGVKINNHKEGAEILKSKKFDEIITMSLHVIEGHEYKEKISRDYGEVTEPLLYNEEDYIKIANDSEINDFEKNDAIIFMGHGSDDIADKTYGKMQQVYENEGKNDIYIGTVEGEILLEDVIEKMKNKGYRKILLKPFMMVAGEHAKNDMASAEEDSWKTLLENEGYEVSTCLKGMGEHKVVREMFMDKLEKVISK